MTKFWTILATGAALLASVPASATIIDVTFGGTFDTAYTLCSPLSQPSPTNCAQSAIATAFSGSFSYSTDPGYQILTGSITSAAFATVGRPTTITSTGTTGFVYQPLPGNSLGFQNILGSQFFNNLATITLTYPASQALNPASPAPLSLTQSARFAYTTFGSPGGTGPRFEGAVTSFAAIERVAAVPEPATWLMLMAGVGVVGGSLRRRRSPQGILAAV